MAKIEPVISVQGNFLLTDTKYVFIKTSKRQVKIVQKKCLRQTDRIVMCDRCNALPAYQLDMNYANDIHDFTLCRHCLKELEDIEF